MIQQIIFVILCLIVFKLAFDRYNRIYKNINLGKDYDTTGHDGTRMKNMLLVAFGQKKMFKRIVPALLHLTIYSAFLVTQIELLEIFVDGIFGTHRFFYPYLSIELPYVGMTVYAAIISTIEILSVLAFVATFAFLARRNLLKLPRFVKPEMGGWPKLDANIILFVEIILVTCIFMMNGADEVLYNHGHSHAHGVEPGEIGSYGFAISQF
ncbi:MAG: Fe-S oxidoreductase, partial [Saprospiraceae bacterium]